MDAVRALLFVASLALLCSACIGITNDDRARDALGPEYTEPGPRHRAGQPCLLCHSDIYGQSPYFAVAGTVYQLDGVSGAGGVQVQLVDATGDEFIAITNDVGNFFVREREWSPTFPLSADLNDGVNRIGMRSPISREGSCAACHSAPMSATSAGPIVIGAFP